MIRVMLVDDSAVVRGLLARIVDAEEDMSVVASASNGRAALDTLRRERVDVVVLDVEMPEMDGIMALPLILAEKPGLQVIMASALTTRGAQVTMRALSLGAADYIGKPTSLSAVQGMEAIAREFVAKIRALGAARTAPPAQPAPRPAKPAFIPGTPGRPRIVTIASSTGGPNALSSLISRLPAGFPLPILIAQHMPPLFTSSLAERLQRESGLRCTEAVDGEWIEPGHIYIAPGDYHLRVAEKSGNPVLTLDQQSPINYCRPSADALLTSAAEVYGPSVLALVLTGMGEDGLRGCRAVVEHGGRVIAQDRDSSVVWGMPGAVANAGLASEILPLDRIPAQLGALCAAYA